MKAKTSNDVAHSLLDAFAFLADYILSFHPLPRVKAVAHNHQTSWIALSFYLELQERASSSPAQHSWLRDFFSSSNAKEDHRDQINRYLYDTA